MGESLITRRAGAGGGGEATITFENYSHATNLTHISASDLSSARASLAGASVGEYALFAGGGNNNSSYYSTVDAYNTSLTRSTPTALSTARLNPAGASVGEYALFAGGYGSGYPSYYSTVDAYNTSLTRSTPTTLSGARTNPAGASVGGYALFAGGIGSPIFSTVDAYCGTLELSLFPNTKYKLNDMPSEQTSTYFQTLSIPTPVNGYMKIQNATLQN